MRVTQCASAVGMSCGGRAPTQIDAKQPDRVVPRLPGGFRHAYAPEHSPSVQRSSTSSAKHAPPNTMKENAVCSGWGGICKDETAS